MARDLSHLPDWPRCLGATIAADYLGISNTNFYREVDAGNLPAPVWITAGRKVWLRDHLDAWLDAKAGISAALPTDTPGNDADAEDWMKRVRNAKA